MFNITGKYCKVWAVDIKENMVLVDLTTSKKEKDGTYTNSKYFKVKFVGKCLQAAQQLQEGDKIDITNGMIGKRKYQEKYYDDVVVFGFEYSDGSTRTAQDEKPADQSSNFGEDFSTDGFQSIEDDSDIPF